MNAPRWVLALLLWLFGAWVPAAADDFRPAYLQVTQVDAQTYDVLWKLPALDEATTLKLSPVFPPQARMLTPVTNSYASGTATQRWRIAMPGGLPGQSVRFPGMGMVRVDVLVRMVRIDGTVQLGRVLAGDPSFVFKDSPDAIEVARTYTLLGIEHILTGFDHLLFVLALLLLVDGVRRLVATITAFTVAHSLTLVAATLGWVRVPGPPVEAAIALSIVFLAAEIVHARQGTPGLAQRRPWLVAFCFGLLHGLGFASALAEVGLPPLAIPTALLFFNIGVEIGQLVFVATALGVIAAMSRLLRARDWAAPRWLWWLPPYSIGGVAAFWFVRRVAGFW
jgi:hydrogenase/urease accessory protein HupE